MVDTTIFQNVSSLQGAAYFVNYHTQGLMFMGGIVVFFLIILMAMLKNNEPFENALAVASWSMFVVSLFFWLGHLIPTLFMLVFLFIVAFDVLYLYASRRQ